MKNIIRKVSLALIALNIFSFVNTYGDGTSSKTSTAPSVEERMIKINLDNDKTEKNTQSNGIIYNGQLYLPIDLVSDVMGKKIHWNPNSNDLFIGLDPKDNVSSINVSSAQEFVDSLGSNRKIILEPGLYDLSKVTRSSKMDSPISWEKVSDGYELNVRNIENLSIEGSQFGKSEIVTSPRFANIINFSNVKNISISNITAGHTPLENYECEAGVLKFSDSSSVSIKNSELYGCGSVGVRLLNVDNFNFVNSTITDCSLRAVSISRSNNISFTGSKFIKNHAFANIISIYESDTIVFEDCVISDNNKFTWNLVEAINSKMILFENCSIFNNHVDSKNAFSKNISMFDTDNSSILIKDSIIKNNSTATLLNTSEDVFFINSKIFNNSFDK